MHDKRVARTLLFAIFMVSGFSGLIYESIWSHYLKLFLGHAALAQTLVLAIFMGGMSLGSWLVSWRSQRIRRLLVGYAVVEGVIGCLALVFHSVFLAGTGWAFDSLLPSLQNPAAIQFAKWSLAAALILPQSVLLGTTFPLMSGAIVRLMPERSGETLAMLYFTNSLGAAIGVLASGFILIGKVGLPGTVMAAGLLNIVIALAVWLLWKSDGFSHGAAPPPATTTRAAVSGIGRWILAGAALTGAAAFMYEIAWIRMLSLVLGSSTHSFELMLSAFILGIALGGLWVHRRIDALPHPVSFLGKVMLVMALVALASLGLYESTFSVMAYALQMFTPSAQGYVGFHLASHAIALAMMIPTTFFCGMTLPVMTQILLRSGDGERAIGAVYSWNTVGAIVGVMLAVHWLMPALGLKGLVIVAAAMHAALAVVYLCIDTAPARRMRVAWRPAAVAMIALVAAASLIRFDPLRLTSGVYRHGQVTAPGGAQILYFRHGKTASISLIGNAGYVGIATNGKPDATIGMHTDHAAPDEITMTLAGALPLALHPRPEQIANIGIGSGLTSHVLLTSPIVRSLDTVEIEPLMAEAARLGFMPRVRGVFEDPRSHIHFDDAKTFFATHRARYDVIVSEPSNPWVSGVASLFSDEFYAQLTRYLQPDGMLLQWVQIYETDIRILSSVILALAPHFSDFALYNADDSNIIIVAVRTGSVPTLGAALFANPATATELNRVGLRTLSDIQGRYLGSKEYILPLARSFGVPRNSDYFPFVDLEAIRARVTRKTAIELSALTALPVPVFDLLQHRLPLQDSTALNREGSLARDVVVAQAVFLRDALLDGRYDTLTADVTRKLRSLTLAKDDCDLAAVRGAWLDAVYYVASLTGPSLGIAELKRIWQQIDAAPCAQKLRPEERNWLDLMRATAMRDTAALMASGLPLLDSALVFASREQFLFALTAITAAALAEHQPQTAAALLAKYPQDVASSSSYTLSLRMLGAVAQAQLGAATAGNVTQK